MRKSTLIAIFRRYRWPSAIIRKSHRVVEHSGILKKVFEHGKKARGNNQYSSMTGEKMKFTDRQTVFNGSVVNVETANVELPNGFILRMEKINHPGGAAVLILDERNRLCFLKQYRCVLDDWLIEIPAGKIDAGEEPLMTAQRELAEETGIVAEQWESLGSMISSPGVFTERVHLYLARKIIEHRRVETQQDEVYELGWMSLDDAYDQVMDGLIFDAKTVIAICKAKQYLLVEQGLRKA